MKHTDAPESVRSLLLKVQALADQGLAGEAEAAAAMLKRLCQKHGITLEELGRPQKKECVFTFKNPLEKMILNQCAFFVCQRPESDPLMGWTRQNKTIFDLTEAEHIDLVDCYKHYRKVWAEHLDEVMQAFIFKHRLTGPVRKKSVDAEEPEMDPIKLQRIVDMIRSMSACTWNKPTARLTA